MSVDYQLRYQNARPSYTKVNKKRFADLPAHTSVLIPSPQDIEQVINNLGRTETLCLTELRQRLAERHGADGACPVMTGMNLRVAAEVSLEALDAAASLHEVTPVWLVIDPDGALAPKLPGGRDRIAALRSIDNS